MPNALVHIAVLFTLGVSAGAVLPLDPWRVWALLLLTTCTAGLAHHFGGRRLAQGALLLGLFLSGVLRVQLADPWLDPRHLLRRAQPGEGGYTVLLETDPRPTRPGGWTARAEMLRGSREGVLRGQVGLICRTGRLEEFRQGDVLRCTGRVEVGPGAWTGADRGGGYSSERGRFVVTSSSLELLARDKGSWLSSWMAAARRNGSERLERNHPRRTAAFLRRLLLGERPEGLSEVEDDFRRGGVVHVLAISGLHTGLLALIVWNLLGTLGGGPFLRGSATLATVTAYALITGARPSVVRAALMTAVLVGGRLADRKVSPMNSLAFAVLLELSIRPLSLFGAAFQLSYGATLGLIYLTPWLMHVLDVLPGYFNSLLSLSIAASLATAPLLLLHFGALSTVGWATGLVVVPLVSIIVPTALAGLCLDILGWPLAHALAAVNHGFVEVLVAFVGEVARLPFAMLEGHAPPPLVILAYYGLLVVAGDWRNLAAMLFPSKVPSTRPPPPGVLWLHRSAGADLLVRSTTVLERERLHDLAGDEEVDEGLPGVASLRRRLEHTGEELDPRTLRFLAFAEAHLLAPRASDGTMALIGLLLALQNELDARFFRYVELSEAQSTSLGLARAPRLEGPVVPLPVQVRILRSLALAGGVRPWDRGGAVRVVRAVRSMLSGPEIYLDSSRLGILLDQVVKKYHGSLLEGARFSRSEAMRSVEEIFGGVDYPLLRQIVAAGRLSRVIFISDLGSQIAD